MKLNRGIRCVREALNKFKIDKIQCQSLSTGSEKSESIKVKPVVKTYPIKQIQMNTCGTLYSKLKTQNHLYANCSLSGLPVVVRYADSFPDTTQVRPTILALPGILGTEEHYVKLIEYFTSRQIRVLVPNFPTYSLTKQTGSYWHSALESAQFIRDFLQAIRVKQVDCLVSHSTAVIPASHIWSENDSDLNIKSWVFLSTPSPKWFRNQMNRLCELIAKLSYHSEGRSMIDNIPTHILARFVTSKLKCDSIDDIMTYLLTLHHSQCDSLTHRITQFTKIKSPTLLVYGEKDRLIDRNFYEEMSNLLTAKMDNYKIVNANQEIIKEAVNSWIKVLVLKAGGNLAFDRFSNMINSEIENLINQVC